MVNSSTNVDFAPLFSFQTHKGIFTEGIARKITSWQISTDRKTLIAPKRLFAICVGKWLGMQQEDIIMRMPMVTRRWNVQYATGYISIQILWKGTCSVIENTHVTYVDIQHHWVDTGLTCWQTILIVILDHIIVMSVGKDLHVRKAWVNIPTSILVKNLSSANSAQLLLLQVEP